MILKRLFGAVWDSGGIMVATSNRHPENLYEKGLNRPLFLPFIAELQRRCEVWKLEGNQDYRMSSAGKEGGRVTVFFDDQRDFEGSLRIATNAAPPNPMTIQVMMNRVLQVQSYEDEGAGKVVVKATLRTSVKAISAPQTTTLCADQRARSTSQVYTSSKRTSWTS